MEWVWKSATISHAWALWGTAVIGGIVSLPVGVALAAWLTVRRRQAGVDPRWALRSAVAEVLMVFGTAPWLWLTLTPNPGHVRGRNLVPFRDLISQVHVGPLYATMQIGGNLLVFAALGFGLPVRWRVGPVAAFIAGAVGSTIIETLQWVLDLGRFSSVDDVIVNAAGAFLAAWCARPWWRRRQPVGDHGRVERRRDAIGPDGPRTGAVRPVAVAVDRTGDRDR